MAHRCKYGQLHNPQDAPGHECVYCEAARLRAEASRLERLTTLAPEAASSTEYGTGWNDAIRWIRQQAALAAGRE